MTKRAASAKAVEPEVDWPQEAAQVVNQGGALAVMQGGAAIVRAENEALIEYAIRYPRDPIKAIGKAMAELDIDPEFAAKQWYSIPYRATSQRGDQALCPCQGKKPGHPNYDHTLVEGVSIKGALACGRAWGNCGVKALLIDETDDKFVVEGLAVDRESLFTVSRVGAISKFIRRRDSGRVEKIGDEKFPQLIQAAASKQARNALLAIMPEPLIRRYWARARALAAEVEATKLKAGPESRKLGVVESFAPYLDPRPKDAPKDWRPDLAKVKARIEDVLKCALRDAKREDLAELRGVLNALESGDARVGDYFPDVDGSEESEESGPSPAPEGSPLGKATVVK